jgi:uncharacterized membrane protein
MFGMRYFLSLIILILILPVACAFTIHGTIYEWSTFEPLDNALIEVNSTPVQFRVATSGVYSFNLPPGNYLIKTSYYDNDTLEYYSEDNMTVTEEDGDFVVDILLFPLEEDEDEFPDEDLGNVTFDIGGNQGFDWNYVYIVVLLFIILAAAGYYYYRQGDEKEMMVVPETYQEEPQGMPKESRPDISAPLPDDLREIITILEGAGGRLTQMDLRKKLNCSEAKVSLMITDLETRGLVQKIKKGRGNILILEKNNI